MCPPPPSHLLSLQLVPIPQGWEAARKLEASQEGRSGHQVPLDREEGAKQGIWDPNSHACFAVYHPCDLDKYLPLLSLSFPIRSPFDNLENFIK